ncbi:MAG: N-acetyltransferase [Thermomicrobiales bacterium]|nr:N-acetyltransferase [Thermomicrobiales bacterium]
MISVRRATVDDVPAITRIYNEGIADRVATLETEPRTEEERSIWLEQRTARTPVFVGERDGEVLGWGSLNTFNPRPAYRFVADFSVYVGRSARGAGVGSALIGELIEAARGAGYHKLVLAAFPFNEAGMRLYARHGFRVVGIYREQGVLEGRWVDTIVMELLLDTDPPPAR